MAHPMLAPDKHPECKEKFYALMKCHHDHPIANLWGKCKDDLHALQQCCREEKKQKRDANIEKAKLDRERLLEKIQKRKGAAGDATYIPGYGIGAAAGAGEEPLAQ